MCRNASPGGGQPGAGRPAGTLRPAQEAGPGCGRTDAASFINVGSPLPQPRRRGEEVGVAPLSPSPASGRLSGVPGFDL